MKTSKDEFNVSADFFQHTFDSIEHHLLSLEKDDAPLRHYLQRITSHRLGPYFEHLWLYWLQNNEHYRCLDHNVQIRDAGKTIGEFDIIVEDLTTQTIEHWEIAIKFYLGIPPLNNETHWLGPHQKDRLDLKYHHLVEKQLNLSQNSVAKQHLKNQGWDISQRKLISKGRLFYPLNHTPTHPSNICKHHLRGIWLGDDEFTKEFKNNKAHFYWLNKDEWMVLRPRQPQSFNDIQNTIKKQTSPHPIQLLVHHWQDEPVRLFIVPEQWLQRSLGILATL